MSGGSYDYVSGRIEDAAAILRERHSGEPHVLALASLLSEIGRVMHSIEWADSCDTSWNAELDAAIREIISPAAELHEATTRAERAAEVLKSVLDRADSYTHRPPTQENAESSGSLLRRSSHW